MPISLSNIFGKINDLYKKEDSVVAVDIGSSSIKVVQLRKDGPRILLETYGELSTGPYVGLSVGQATSLTTEKIVEVMKDLFTEANVTSKTGVMSIPLRTSLIATLEIPRSAEANLANAVPIEARKFVPVPISEVVLDWWVVPEKGSISSVQKTNEPSKMTEVLVAAIHKDTVLQYQEIAKVSGLNLKFFEIETFSAIRSLLSNDISPNAIVDFGAATTKVTIVDYGIVRMSHTINKGSQDISTAISKSLSVPFEKGEEIKRKIGLLEHMTQGEISATISPIVEYILSEVSRVIVNYQKKHLRAVEKIIMIGGGTQLKGLMDLAKKHTEIPITIGTSFDKIEAPAFLDNVLKEAGPSFAVAIGLALRRMEES